MKKIMKIILSASILFALTGCATTKTVWTSTSAFQTAENKYYEATITPVKSDDRYYVSFRLDVVNKYGEDLEIDWNRTKYILNDRTDGVFVFKGINPEDIKNQTIPGDKIPAGAKFTKDISPFRMVARSPVKSGKDQVYSPGILPNGENGVYLVIRQGDKEITEKLTVIIEEIKG